MDSERSPTREAAPDPRAMARKRVVDVAGTVEPSSEPSGAALLSGDPRPPQVHGLEVRPGLALEEPDGVDGGESAGIPQRYQRLELGVQPVLAAGEGEDVCFLHLEAGAGVEVAAVVGRDERVEAVVAAAELEHDQHPGPAAGRARTGRARCPRLPIRTRRRRRGARARVRSTPTRRRRLRRRHRRRCRRTPGGSGVAIVGTGVAGRLRSDSPVVSVAPAAGSSVGSPVMPSLLRATPAPR